MTTSAEIRERLIKTLSRDLVGPSAGDSLEHEQLWESEQPSRWYLTGFLVPTTAPENLRFDPESSEVIDSPVGGEETGDDDVEPDTAPAKRAFLPSSIGISVLVPPGTESIDAQVLWGEYRKETIKGTNPEQKTWQRTQRSESIKVPLPHSALSRIDIPESKGVRIYVSVRDVADAITSLSGLPGGTRAVSVFVVNERDSATFERAEESLIFQVELILRLEAGFVPRPNIRGLEGDDPDERIADLQYRDAFEFSVGHGVSTHAELDGALCREVRSTWIPIGVVEKVDPAPIEGVELSMETLAEAKDSTTLIGMLTAMVPAYSQWILTQKQVKLQDTRRAEVAADLLQRCTVARDRINAGIALLAKPVVFEAFCIANRAMADAARQRNAQIQGKTPAEVSAPAWRPFQLAFILMNLPGLVEPTHHDRDVVDLLFFPTGGGKTEAYLGLAAFTLVLRRLNDSSIRSAGMSVLMRYTLRLLTLDQLGRAAGLICALELLRQQDIQKLGEWPFEIGLWVGQKATPNRMGYKGDNDRNSARARTIAYQNDAKGKPSPIPLESCPWCGHKFSAQSFTLVTCKPVTGSFAVDNENPNDLRIVCANPRCQFTRDNALPIVSVDEPLYRRLPCFVIATVDKFASMPWLTTPGKFFGKVDRFNKLGFLGPGEKGDGTKLPDGLPPPDLIIQDELHLISGPLGTMVGLYETAVDGLCARVQNGKTVRPKVIASTATVRRAEAQVRALFARTQVDVFPPPGPDRRDSFFAKVAPATEKNPRLYVGVAAQGRSLKVVLLRAYLALLSAAQTHYDQQGGASNTNNPVDPYMSLVGYFNALRELGGSRRIVEDEVRGRLRGYDRRRRMNEPTGEFTKRTIEFDALELTSRITTNKVAEAKQRLALGFHEDNHVDVALATNMISVGLDITRLGLMVVLGQPKTTAEYIQATSRVGRDDQRPGLVVALMNIHRPRDRSHYERFEAYHSTFYRAVEATSVTPFAPRAVDRGLAAITVSLARHGDTNLTAPERAIALPQRRTSLGWLNTLIKDRAAVHRKDLTSQEQAELSTRMDSRVDDLLDAWVQIANGLQGKSGLQYGSEVVKHPPLLHAPLDPELQREPPLSPLRKFKAQWSLRDVEAEVPVIIKRMDGGDVA